MGDIDRLSQSISIVGLLHPIVVKSNRDLIAGARRIAAVTKLGWSEVPVTIADNIDDVRAALIAERDENECRLNFTPSESVALAKQLEPMEKEAARGRQALLNGKNHASVKFTEAEKGESGNKIAEAVGMSRPTLAKAAAIVQAAEKHPEHYADLREEMDRTGKVSPAYQQLAERQEKPEAPKTSLPHKPTKKRDEDDEPPKSRLEKKPIYWLWSKSIQSLYEQFNIIDGRGGIDALLDEWSKDDLKTYLNTLRDVRERCNKYIPKMEKRIKK